jgi:transposase, IS6 family
VKSVARFPPRSAFAEFRFPGRVIMVGCAGTCATSYRDIEELLAERGIEVDHVTIYRWVQRSRLYRARIARTW